jgi:hypothetical protein
MSWTNMLGGMLQQYAGVDPNQAPPQTEQDFQQVANAAPREHLTDGIAEAFRSNQTPSFGNMLSGLFDRSNPQQKAGLLNTLVGTIGPGMLSSVLARAGAGTHTGQTITPEMAQQIPPQAINQVAEAAEKHDPSIVDRVSSFYSEHPTLVQTLGAGALAVVMGKMAKKL